MRDPVLATINHGNGKLRTTVFGGLHRIGTQAPYFSITADTYEYLRNGHSRWSAGGCQHELIEELLPGRFTDLIALHLSTQGGVPMHVEGNGYYWIAGALGGLGQRYHGGNSTPRRTQDECLAIAAKHFRLSLDDARALAERIRAAYEVSPRSAPGELSRWVQTQHPRWKAEADACIAKHNLVVYGR